MTRELMGPNSRLRLFDRVRNMSSESANRKIDIRTQHAIERGSAGGRAAMEGRLRKLFAAKRDRRWLWGR